LKRALLTASFAAALAVALIVALFVVRSRDAAAVAPAARTANRSAVESVDVELPTVANDSHERVEADEQHEVPPPEDSPLTGEAPRAKFRGRLVYESTGQGVPWCGVELRGSGPAVEFCTTDDDGRFKSQLAFPLAHTHVLVLDQRRYEFDWDRAIDVHREDAESESTVSVSLPATFTLSGDFPDGLNPSQLSGLITSLDDKQQMGAMQVRQAGPNWFAREEAPTLLGIAVAREQVTRALGALKLPSGESDPYESHSDAVDRMRKLGPPWKVLLASGDGKWSGAAAIDRLEGVIAIAPQWIAFGQITLEFRGNWVTAPTWTVAIELHSNIANVQPSPDSGRLNELETSPLHFDELAPGSYTMVVTCNACDRLEQPVSVRAGETTHIVVQLNCVASAGSIRGEITSQTGQKPRDEILVNLWRPGLASFNDGIDVVDEPISPWKASFEIKDVLAGDYQLGCTVGEFGVAPSSITTVRAGDIAHLRVLDDPTYVDIGFRVFDAESGAQLDTFDVAISRNGKDSKLRDQASGTIVAEHVPENGWLWWSLTSPGHVCEQTDFMHPAVWGLSSGSKRWIDVRLQRGWRIKCAAFDDEYNVLKDATIVADGIDMGTTDADGYFTLTLPQRPKRIEARYRDWRCIESDTNGLETMESCDEVGFVFERKH
jgi:hypothetical protein